MELTEIDIKDLYALCFKGYQNDDLFAFTDWAERQVTAGDQSELLLILASLGLDAIPEREAIKTYFERYLEEMKLDYPSSIICKFYYRRYLFKLMMAETDTDKLYKLIEVSSLIDWDERNRCHTGIVNYMGEVYSDMVLNENEDQEYLYFINDYHMKVYHVDKIGYIKSVAKRFFRLLDCEDNYYVFL